MEERVTVVATRNGSVSHDDVREEDDDDDERG